jgi:hypothetical protein
MMGMSRLAAFSLFIAFGIAATPAAIARTSTDKDRILMAVAAADAIRDDHSSKTPPFNGAKSVEIGEAIIEFPWALADWRADGARGQVLLRHVCDHWNVWAYGTNALTSTELARHGLPLSTAAALLSELSAQEGRHIAWVTSAKPNVAC